MNAFDAPTVDTWREWLERHHDSESEVWLIFHKKHTGKPSVAYTDALDEALCYGWIDSLIKRIDANRYARKFTPRKAESKWSSVNIKRYAELRAANRLKEPGLARCPDGRPIADGARAYKLNTVPAYIAKAIKHPRIAACTWPGLILQSATKRDRSAWRKRSKCCAPERNRAFEERPPVNRWARSIDDRPLGEELLDARTDLVGEPLTI
jgi:hypothetical protein